MSEMPRPPLSSPDKKSINVHHLEIAKHLERIDFPVLKSVFQEKIKSLGLEPSKNLEEFVEKDGIDDKKSGISSHAAGAYNPFQKKLE